MKKILAILVILAMAGVLFTGCGSTNSKPASDAAAKSEAAAPEAASEAAAPEATAASSEEPAVEETGEGYVPNPADFELIDVTKFDKEWNLDSEQLGKFELTYSTHDPITSLASRFAQEWADLIYGATNGGVEITIQAGGTIASAADALSAAEMGTADISWVCSAFVASQLPITNLFNLACIGLGDNNIAVQVMWDLYEKYEPFQKEFSDLGLKMLMLYNNGENFISTVGFKPDSLESLAGKKIRTIGGTSTDFAEILGASPVSMGPGDIYDAISKKVIDGYQLEPHGMASFNVLEVTEYYSTEVLFTVPFVVLMNQDSFDNLPAEYQEVIEYYSTRQMSAENGYQWNKYNHEIMDAEDQSKLVDFDEASVEKIHELAKEYNKTRAEAATTAEFDAVAFVDDIYALSAQYGG